jgi:hypothetical protein
LAEKLPHKQRYGSLVLSPTPPGRNRRPETAEYSH